LKDSEILTIFNKEVRQECEWTRMRREVLPNLVRYTLTGVGNGGGHISWSNMNSENADEAIQSQVEYFKERNVDFEWKYYNYDQLADLPQRLMAHGFTSQEPEALMVADMNDLPVKLQTMDLTIVKRVTTPNEVDEIVRMESEVWNEDISGFASGMKFDLEHHPDHISVFAVWRDERIVSAAWTHYLPGTSFATLWGGSTLKQFRKHGYYSALLAIRVREARQRGYHFLQVDASPESQPILAKNGFRCLAYSTPYEWAPDKS
jgi:GNAT superfamily N-acetyltransferase